ncbi:MAG: CbiQ family ECF transporter T component [Ignavibacteriales bacterium]
MDIAYLDYLSTSGRTPMHRASPAVKMLFATLAVAGAVAARDLRAASAVLAIMLGLSVWACIPVHRAAHLLAYPALFGWIFSGDEPLLGALRAVAAAMALILLLGTTTFASIHAILARMMPRVISDSVYMTYRSLFLLAGQITALGRVLRLRGGRSLSAVGAAFGTALVHSIDTSERVYSVLVVRGYGQGMASLGPAPALTLCDIYPVCAGIVILLAGTML